MKTHNLTAIVFSAAVMILTPMALKADWAYDSGTKTITDSTWTLNVSAGDNNTLTVTGVNTAPGSASALDLSLAVTDGSSVAYTIVSIGDSALQNCAVLSDVTLPDSMTSIGNNAFYNCGSLVTVTPFLPDAITNIGVSAFESCTSLTGDLALKNPGMKALSGSAFAYTKITGADMAGSGITTIPNNNPYGNSASFWQCASLTNVIFSAALENIGKYAFYECTALMNLVFPDTLKSVEEYAFYNCGSLVTVTPFLPDAITNIGSFAFCNCTSLTGDLVLKNPDLKTIACETFDFTKITSADMADSGITTMLNNNPGNFNCAFYSCKSLTNVIFSAALENIGKYAFYDCTALMNIDFPDTLGSIGLDAFCYCSNLVSVTPFLPGSVTNIGVCAFMWCHKIAGDLKLTNADLSLEEKSGGQIGSQFAECDAIRNLEATGVKSIPAYAFYSCDLMTNAILSDTLESIEQQAFFSCSNLVSVTPFLPGGLMNIGVSAFESCTSLIGDLMLTNPGMKTLSGNTFPYTKITSVNMAGSGITTMLNNNPYNDNCAFWQCMSLTNAILPAVLENVGTYVFYECTLLEDLYFLGDVPDTIPSTCFNNIPQYTTRVFVPRFNSLWENFAETNAAINPLTADETSAFVAAHPGESLPVGVWETSSTKLWYSDKPYEGTDAFYIRGEPVNAGEVSPAYGIITNIAINTEIQCSAPADAVFEGKYYVCTGSVTEDETSDHVWANSVTNSGTNVTVTKSGIYQQRLTWLWDFNGYFVDTTNYHGEGTVTLSPDSPFNNNCFSNGVSVEFTAEPADGWYFRRWVGDVPEADAANATVTVTVDGLKSCKPVFTHGWTYYSNNTISDGNWMLNASVGDNNTLTITGVNTVTNQSVLDLSTPVVGDDNTTQYTIVGIGDNAFNSKKELIYVFLSDSMTSIGDKAFYDCTELKVVTPFLPDSITNIGSFAFWSCTSLTGDLVLKNPDLKTIACEIFDITKITSVDMSGSGITTILNNNPYGNSCTFWQCAALTNVILSDTLENIGKYSFYECTALTDIALPDAVKAVGDYAFWTCTSLTNVVMSDTLESIGHDAFCHCSNLVSVTPFLPGSVTNIGVWAFTWCHKLTGDLKLTNPDITMSDKNNEGQISSQFTFCYDISSADMTGFTSLPGWIFTDCSSLTNVVFSDKIVLIGCSSFAGCINLTDFYFQGDVPTIDTDQTFSRIPEYTIRFRLPKKNKSWEDFGANNTFVELTPDEKTIYENKFPNEQLPYATWVAPGGTVKQWVCGWVPPKDALRTTVLILK